MRGERTLFDSRRMVERVGDLRNPEMSWAAKGAAGLAIARAAQEVYGQTSGFARQKFAYTVAVKGDDPIYQALHRWLLANMKPSSQRALEASTKGRSYDDYADMLETDDSGSASSDGKPPSRMRLLYDGNREQFIRLGRHRIAVSVVSEDLGNVGDIASRSELENWGISTKKIERIVFTTFSAAARQSVVELIEKITEDHFAVKRAQTFYVNSAYGHWNRLPFPTRPVDTVVLEGSIMEDLIEDVGRFLDDEERYMSIGQPWHRGYLLVGPPGTGKTSIPKAIATHFNMDMHYINMSGLGENPDSSMVGLVSNIGANQMLLLEDIDTVTATMNRDEEDPELAEAHAMEKALSRGVSQETLFQVLDGVATPHGLIVFMTTNHLDRIDEALVRPGRADKTITIGHAGPEQVDKIFQVAFEEPLGLKLPGTKKMAPTRVIEAIKGHLYDVEAARAAVKQAWKDHAQ